VWFYIGGAPRHHPRFFWALHARVGAQVSSVERSCTLGRYVGCDHDMVVEIRPHVCLDRCGSSTTCKSCDVLFKALSLYN
jgi:hypothetical protein